MLTLVLGATSPEGAVGMVDQLTRLSAYGLMFLFMILLFTGRFIVLAREKAAVEIQLAEAKADAEQWKQAALDALGVAGGVVDATGRRR